MPLTYEPFTLLPSEEKEKLIAQSIAQFDNKMIVSSAAAVLHANQIHNIHPIDMDMNFSKSFRRLLEPLPKNLSNPLKRYNFFSLLMTVASTTFTVAVVLDMVANRYYVIPSLRNHLLHANNCLHVLIEEEILPNYPISRYSGPIQQQEHPESGVHTAANIVNLIRGSINIVEKKGIEVRSPEELNQLFGLFTKAYSDSQTTSHKGTDSQDSALITPTLIEPLKNYIITRQNDPRDYYHPSFRSFFFYTGYSRAEKLIAAQELLILITKEHYTLTELDQLASQHPAVKQGRLGTLYQKLAQEAPLEKATPVVAA